MSLQEQIDHLEERVTGLFIVSLATFLVAVATLGLGMHDHRELNRLRSELDRQNARVTSLIAEVRGIGG